MGIGRFNLRSLDLLNIFFFSFNFFLISPHGLQHIFGPFDLNVSSHVFENTVPSSSPILPLSFPTLFSPTSPNLLFLLPILLLSSSVFTPLTTFLPSSLATIFSPPSPNLLFLPPISLLSSSIFTSSLLPTSPLLSPLLPEFE